MTVLRLAKNRRLPGIIQSLNDRLIGWHGYLKAVWSAYPQTPFRSFDAIVRRRLRATLSGEIGNGPWNLILTKAWLRGLGLGSLDELQRQY